ncbi:MULTISPECIES: hypothetical protein [Actinosynnema]|uniref:hypothetical protein n=1 Tax=Actinosynnema TaxID=40566 RepID=UPI0020A3CD3F|nr:hypothetical protein [Actinosynnema pretiosum]MCP2099462.1 hypothetical protein [Actinosynnema pretiosum]
MANPGFELGATGWTASPDVVTTPPLRQPSRSGVNLAWLSGAGRAQVDTLAQSVTLPAGCRAELTFWLHVDTAETWSAAKDVLRVTVDDVGMALS